jgi:hypothetical protein
MVCPGNICINTLQKGAKDDDDDDDDNNNRLPPNLKYKISYRNNSVSITKTIWILPFRDWCLYVLIACSENRMKSTNTACGEKVQILMSEKVVHISSL